MSNPQERIYAKFLPIFKGPYRIRRVLHNNCYEIEDPVKKRIIGKYNSASIKLYYEPDENN